MSLTFIRLALPTTLLLVFAWPLPLRPQEPQVVQVFSEVIDVRVVNIEVVVTDRDKVRVTGLGPEDFRLLVDGEEVPIEYFSEVRGQTVIADGGDTGGVQSVPSLQPGRPVGTSYLIYIDDVFSRSRDRNRVLDRMEAQLLGLGPDERVAMVAYDGRNLEMLTSWTRSERTIKEAIRAAKDRHGQGIRRDAERRMNDRDRALNRDLLGPDDRGRWLNELERHYAQEISDRVAQSINAATATLRSFAEPPGRKVMLILSGGWPFSPTEYAIEDRYARTEDLMAAMLELGINERDRLVRPLSDTANLLGYTLYPVDVPGMDATSPNDVGIASAPLVRGTSTGIFAREHLVQDTLIYLANETGGRPLLNSQRDHAFEHVTEDIGSYYWLGFSPQRENDDGRHEIRVEVRDKKWRVRARNGYVDLSRESEVTMMVESALLFGNPVGRLPLRLDFGRPEKAGKGKVQLPISIGIPAESIALVPASDDRLAAQLEIRVSVVDTDGNRSGTPMQPFTVYATRAPEPNEMIWYDTAILMRKREHRIAVAVYDQLSGALLSSTADIDPGKKK